MSIFGWSLPPGCSLNDIDELYGEHGPDCFCEDCLGDPPEETCIYDEDDEITGGAHYSDVGDYASSVSEFDA